MRVCDALVVAAATLFVLWKLHPGLLVEPTITTGGDTASHYFTAWWLRHELLPQGRITGWVPGNYAGFPLFQVYFPLPFVLIAGLSLLTGLPVAFKLVTAAGLVGLPLAAYTCFRLLRFSFPAPALAALCTVPFLFHEGDSMWGANVGSTLAGEFTYSFGTALLLLLAGTLYRGAISGRGVIGNALLLAAVALSHAYTVLVAAALGAYLVLFHPRGRVALGYLVTVALLAFGLIAIWAIPLIAYAEYTTAYSIVWPIDGFAHVFPIVLWPLLAVLGAGALAWLLAVPRRGRSPAGARRVDHRVGYLAALAVGGLFFYLVAWRLDVVDIRFLPFAQLVVALLAAPPAAAAVRWLATRRGSRSMPLAITVVLTLVVATLVWVDSNIAVVDEWAAWNYAGFEAKVGWPAYAAVNDAVRRTSADPRVAYEHSTVHDEAGTIRAFESLPLFAGASTLEGVYMQSTISSPFVFYIQSEISQVPSCPLLPYHCGRLDARRAAEHLRLFNVTEVIARGDRVKQELADSSEFRVAADVPPYTVFSVVGNDGAYVEPLRFEPLVFTGDRWKQEFFTWFKRPGSGDVPLVRASASAPLPASWERVESAPDRVMPEPLSDAVEVEAEVTAEVVRIHTSRPGHPLRVKISYHPRWQVVGADAVWLASPSFILLIPTGTEVVLRYGPTAIDRAAAATTLLSLVVMGAMLVGSRLSVRGRRRARVAPRRTGWRGTAAASTSASASGGLDAVFRYRPLWAPSLVVLLAVVAIVVRLDYTDPWVPHREGLALFHEGEYAAAEPLLLRSMEAAPSSAAAYYSTYYHALCAYRSRQWQQTLRRFDRFLRDYPDGELVGEANFRIAEALQGLGEIDAAVAQLVHVIDAFPESRWAGLAAARLAAVDAPHDAARGDDGVSIEAP